VVCRGIIRAGNINARGHDVNEVAGLAFEFAAASGTVGPVGDERRRDAAFVDEMLIHAERRVGGVGPFDAVSSVGIGRAGGDAAAEAEGFAVAGVDRRESELFLFRAEW